MTSPGSDRFWEELEDVATGDVSNENWFYVKHTHDVTKALPYTIEFAADIECVWGKHETESAVYRFRFHTHCGKTGATVNWDFGGLWSDGLKGQAIAGSELNQHSDTNYKNFTALADKLTKKYYAEKIG
jgi:hypothetical protein